MKKFSFNFFFMQVGVLLLVSIIVGIVISLYSEIGIEADSLITLSLMALFVATCFYFPMSSLITDRLVASTVKKNAEKHNFENCSTFYGSGAILKIDVQTGRIAYIANQNPFEFQVISAKDITDIKSSYIKGPLGGTSYIYFEFVYDKKRVRIPTFTSRQVYSMKSGEVLEGISKADTYAELLQNAKTVAMQIGV